MKEWWINLSPREKQILLIGGFFVFIFILYEIFWLPVSNKVDGLRSDIQRQQKLLSFMQDANKKIQTLKKNQQPSNNNDASLLAFIQNETNKPFLKNSVTELKQADNNSVQITFTKLSFDTLMSWLIMLWNDRNLIVTDAAINHSEGPGLVQGNLIISN